MKTSSTKKWVPHVLVFFLAFLFCFGPRGWAHPMTEVNHSTKEEFSAALKDYRNGLYQEAAAKLESFLEINREDEPIFRARVYLLLGICYEKLLKEEKARTCFIQLKELLDKKLIEQVPVIEGIDPEVFPGYREVFGGSSFFTFKKPVPVDEMVKKKVVYAPPRKTLEEKEKAKKLKKFFWVTAFGAAVLIGTMTVLLLTKRNTGKRPESRNGLGCRVVKEDR